LSPLQYKTQAVKTLIYQLATSSALFPLVYRLRRPGAIGRGIDDVFPLSRVETVSLDATITSRPHLNAFREWNEKFPTLTSGIARRRSLASVYDQYFRDICVSAETPDARRSESCFVNYPVVVGVDHRDDIYREMLRSGFDIGLSLYPNAHEVETLRDIDGSSANVSVLARSVLTLPTHRRIETDYAHKLARRFVDLLAALRVGKLSGKSR
jgi:dTDP-4-amino-4,6-dideoxygalactose transaminase